MATNSRIGSPGAAVLVRPGVRRFKPVRSDGACSPRCVSSPMYPPRIASRLSVIRQLSHYPAIRVTT